jgi:hypothetical protein
MATTINASASSGLITTADTSTILQLQTGGTTALAVSAAQVVTLTNPLPVASGGSGGTTSTGSGANVLGTTPSFTSTIGVGGATASASGAGITFPSTDLHYSTNANTLDDYEEGTWTPAVRGAGTAGTYTPTTADGTYTKVGRLVTASFRILGFSTASGGTGYMQITGVPFTNAGYACGAVRFQFLTVAGSAVMLDVEFISASGTTTLNFFESYNNAAGQDTPISSVSTSTTLFGTIIYSAV